MTENKTIPPMGLFFEQSVIPLICKNYKSEKSKHNFILYINNCCQYLNTPFEKIDHSLAGNYLVYLKQQVSEGIFSIRTARVRAAALARAGSFLESSCLISGYVNPFYGSSYAFDINPTLQPENVPDYAAMERILKSCTDDQLYLILCYALKCGLSTREICNLKISDIVRSDSGYFISFPLPNAKYRYLKLPDDIAELTAKYLTRFAPVNRCGYLFTNSRGLRLQERTLERRIKTYMNSIGLDYTLQTLRNSAVALLLATKDATVGSVCSYFNITPTWIFRYDKIAENYKNSADNADTPLIDRSFLNVRNNG